MPAKVTAKSLEALPPGVHRVERGLYFRKREGRKSSWVFIYQVSGKRREMSLGLVEDISISRARALVLDFRKLLAEGRDPINARRQAREVIVEESEREAPLTFEAFALDASPAITCSRAWRARASEARWRIGLKKHILPAIGQTPLEQVDRDAVLSVLRPVWSTAPVMAGFVRAQLEALFNYAIATGKMSPPNPAVWRGNLAFFLAPQGASKTRHHEALTLAETRSFLERIRPIQASTAWAVTFCILTASRSGEARDARWEEVDFERAVWSVPPERRKDGKPYPHRVPLSHQALELLRSIPRKSERIFPRKTDEAFGVCATGVLRFVRCHCGHGTLHGLRSTFRDWAAEAGKDETLAEKCLMHTTGSSVVQAYQRSDLLEQRRPLMQEWADAIMPQG